MKTLITIIATLTLMSCSKESPQNKIVVHSLIIEKLNRSNALRFDLYDDINPLYASSVKNGTPAQWQFSHEVEPTKYTVNVYSADTSRVYFTIDFSSVKSPYVYEDSASRVILIFN